MRHAVLSPHKKYQQPGAPMHGPLKIFGYVVVLLMAVSMLYAAYISIKYWACI